MAFNKSLNSSCQMELRESKGTAQYIFLDEAGDTVHDESWACAFSLGGQVSGINKCEGQRLDSQALPWPALPCAH